MNVKGIATEPTILMKLEVAISLQAHKRTMTVSDAELARNASTLVKTVGVEPRDDADFKLLGDLQPASTSLALSFKPSKVKA